MSTFRVFVTLAILATASACNVRSTRPAPGVQIGKTADEIRSIERSSVAERDSQTLATLLALLRRAPDLRELAWREELSLLIARYKDVKPQDKHVVDADARVNAWAEGREPEAMAMVASARADADIFLSRYLQEKSARETAEKAEVASRAASAKEIAALKAEVQKAKDATMRRTAWAIVIGSLAIIGLSVAYVVISPNKFTALQGAGPAGIVGILGLGLAQLITRPWFMTACAGVCVCGLIALAWWARSKYLEGKLAESIKAKAELAQSTLRSVVPAIDDVYDKVSDGAITAGKDVFNALYEKIREKMKEGDAAAQKAQIHQTRAEVVAS